MSFRKSPSFPRDGNESEQCLDFLAPLHDPSNFGLYAVPPFASTPATSPATSGVGHGIAFLWLASEQEIQLSPLHDESKKSFALEPIFDVSTPEVSVLASHVLDPRTDSYVPPVPCDHCRRHRLQCLTIRTTAANPNPVTACSSCVALFRNCSLAERAKRQHERFETGYPVIGHLHGIAETPTSSTVDAQNNCSRVDIRQGSGRDTSSGAMSPSYSKRSSSRMRGRIRPLRQWLLQHQDLPYPSADEKVQLTIDSGLTKTQVENWFVNARRRQKHTDQTNKNQIHLQGSPMPQSSFIALPPFQRWRNSPPDEEHVSPDIIRRSVNHELDLCESSAKQLSNIRRQDQPSLSAPLPYVGSIHDSDSLSGSSSSAVSFETFLSTESYEGGHEFPDLSGPRAFSGGSTSSRDAARYQCTFCPSRFKKRSDWSRHETSIHVHLDLWVCEDQDQTVWQVGSPNPQCNFCGLELPTQEHTLSHDFQSCADRQVSERTFGRKDHLRQHLTKYHGCHSWKGQTLNIRRSRRTMIASRCGFCNNTLTTWPEREDHLAGHFKQGFQMHQWFGDWGFDEETLRTLRKAALP